MFRVLDCLSAVHLYLQQSRRRGSKDRVFEGQIAEKESLIFALSLGIEMIHMQLAFAVSIEGVVIWATECVC